MVSSYLLRKKLILIISFFILAAPVLAFPEKDNEYLFFQKPLDSPPKPETVPAKEDLTAVLKFQLAVGEAEAINFGVHALRDIKELSVEAKNIYMGWRDRDQVAVSVKMMEYTEFEEKKEKRKKKRDSKWWVSRLMPVEKINLESGSTRGYTLILEVPVDGPPGTYEGELLIKSGEEQLGEPVKIAVEVHPFKLKEPRFSWGVFYYGPLRRTRNKTDEDLLAKAMNRSLLEAVDMRAHGLNTFCIYSELDQTNEAYLRAKYGPDINLEYLNRYMEVYRSAGFTGPVPYWLSRKVFTEKEAWYRNNWLKFTEEHLRKSHRVVEAVVRERMKRNWPEILFYLIDEPGQIERARLAARVFEDAHSVPGARTFTCVRPEMTHVYGEHLDVACFHAGANWERIESLRKIYQFETWRYQSLKKTSPPLLTRWVAGVLPWLRNEQGVLFYRHNRLEIDPKIGTSTLAWEALREGINDYKYLHTLQILVEKFLQAENREEAKTIAREAEGFLEDLRNSVVPDGKKCRRSPWSWEKLEQVKHAGRNYILRLLPHLAGARFKTFDEELGHRRDDTKWEDWLKEHGKGERTVEF